MTDERDGLLCLDWPALRHVLGRKLARMDSVLSLDVAARLTEPELRAMVERSATPAAGRYLVAEEDIDAVVERLCDLALERAILAAVQGYRTAASGLPHPPTATPSAAKPRSESQS